MRSRTNNIQLLAIVKRKVLDKYSMMTILQPIMSDLIKLVSMERLTTYRKMGYNYK
jgi:hypothetical protein